MKSILLIIFLWGFNVIAQQFLSKVEQYEFIKILNKKCNVDSVKLLQYEITEDNTELKQSTYLFLNNNGLLDSLKNTFNNTDFNTYFNICLNYDARNNLLNLVTNNGDTLKHSQRFINYDNYYDDSDRLIKSLTKDSSTLKIITYKQDTVIQVIMQPKRKCFFRTILNSTDNYWNFYDGARDFCSEKKITIYNQYGLTDKIILITSHDIYYSDTTENNFVYNSKGRLMIMKKYCIANKKKTKEFEQKYFYGKNNDLKKLVFIGENIITKINIKYGEIDQIGVDFLLKKHRLFQRKLVGEIKIYIYKH